MIKEIFYAIICITIVAITTNYNIGYGYGSAILLSIMYLQFFVLNKKVKIWMMPKIKNGVPTKYGWIVQHPENFVLGDYTDIGFGTYINASYGVTIEDYVQVGSHCSIYSVNTIDSTYGEIIIKKNAMIGAGSVILPRKDGEPLIIGENSTVGALTLIKNSVQPNSIVIGSPARYYIKKISD